jgi:hypothetical protein
MSSSGSKPNRRIAGLMKVILPSLSDMAMTSAVFSAISR